MHRLRLVLLAVTAIAVLTASASAGTSGGKAKALAARADLSRAILVQINAARARKGLHAVRASSELAVAAQRHTMSMARLGYFAHQSLDGSAFWTRVRRFYPSQGFRSWNVGENLLWASPGADAAQVVRAWLGSPAHRRILLAPAWREAGLSAVHAAKAYGPFGGREVTIVTADFGARVR